RGGRREPLPLSPGATFLATAGAVAAALLSVTPIAALALRALGGGGFARVVEYGAESAWNSGRGSLAAAARIAVRAARSRHALARDATGGRRLDRLAMLGFFVPAAVLGAGMISTYTRAPLRGVYGTAAILVIGFVARYAAVGARAFGASVAQSAPSFEQSAA